MSKELSDMSKEELAADLLSMFRKDVRENVEHLDEDALADYRATKNKDEKEPVEVPEEVVIQGSETVGEHITINGEEYVITETYSTTVDTGETFVDGGYESVARHVDAPKISTWTVIITDPQGAQHRFDVQAETSQEAEREAFRQSGLTHMCGIAQKKRGGVRPGAGRKPRPEEYHQTSVDIRPDLYEFLSSLPDTTIQASIEKALILFKKSKEIKMYEIQFELSIGQQTIKDTLSVEADSEERAIEFARHVLEERYEDGVLLELECQIVA